MALRQEPAGEGLWPTDWLILGYAAGFMLLVALYFPLIEGASWLMAAHAGAAALALVVIKHRPRAGSAGDQFRVIFRHWYPLPYVAACYKAVALIIPPIRGVQYDVQMARIDAALWGTNPTLWLERLQTPWLTEFLQIAYSLFVPAVLSIAAILWIEGRRAEFRYYAFLISIGFLVSYVGYLLVPVRGPRFLFAHIEHVPLRGLWLTGWLQQTLDKLESAHYDCFPSGHTELTLLAWWSSRKISSQLFRVFTVFSILIVLATVYLRYHYTIDVVAGAVVAGTLLAVCPYLYTAKRPPIGD